MPTWRLMREGQCFVKKSARSSRTFQQLSGKLQDGSHLGAGLPLAVLEHSETHCAAVGRAVIADVWVVDFRGEGDGWCLEGVACGKGEVEGEDAALVTCVRDEDTQFVSIQCFQKKKKPVLVREVCLSRLR